MQKPSAVSNYFSMIKFSHTIFALPFAMIGFSVAVYLTDSILPWDKLAMVILCMIFARSAAMAFNRFTDRHIDKENTRTSSREIPSGIIKPEAALWFAIISGLLFVATAFFINNLCFYLSPVALLIILGYSYTKRFTFLSHLVLGLGLALAPIGAYLAVTGKFALLPLLFSFAVLFWVSGFDIIYSLQDFEFDKSQNLRSFPVSLGKKAALRLSALFHLFTTGFVIYAGYTGNFGGWYWAGCAVFTLLLTYQHTLVKPHDLSKVNIAFFTTNGIASVLFALFVILDLVLL